MVTKSVGLCEQTFIYIYPQRQWFWNFLIKERILRKFNAALAANSQNIFRRRNRLV